MKETQGKIFILNGPNLDMLGVREPEIYGTVTLSDIEKAATAAAKAEGFDAVCLQYSGEGEMVDALHRAYKEADMALEVGRVFYEEKTILAYNELGIGRLIHQLPESLCSMFLQEVFDGDVDGMFDDEELLTVFTFFDNNLNISETARQLYIHRNTLVYRLEKIQKRTGLDVRVFDDALTFKIAMMVADHMRSVKE